MAWVWVVEETPEGPVGHWVWVGPIQLPQTPPPPPSTPTPIPGSPPPPVPPQPHANFLYVLVANRGVTFINSSVSAASYRWTFGDGGTSSERNPTHFYAADGVYTVVLTAYSSNSSGGMIQSAQYSTSVTVSFIAAQANFNVTSNDLRAYFTDTSTSHGTAWNWDFGDGQVSTAQNPSHQYAAYGTYTVIMSTGGYTVSRQVSITQGGLEGLPVPDFDTSTLTGTAPLSIDFTNLTASVVFASQWEGSGVKDSGLWDYESGSGSLSVDATQHLQDTHALQCNSVGIAYDMVYKNINPAAICGVRFGIRIQTAPNVTHPYVCTINNGFGNIIASVVVDSTLHVCRRRDSDSNEDIGSSFAYTANTWYQVEILYMQNGSVRWRVWNANGTALVYAEQIGPASYYNDPAESIYAGLISTNGHFWLDSFKVHNARYPGPYLPGLPSDVMTYAWDFGDGGTSTDENPSHTYLSSGVFTVTLTVTNALGSASISRQILVSTTAPVGLPNDAFIMPFIGDYYSSGKRAGFYAVEPAENKVELYATDNTLILSFGTGGSENGKLNSPKTGSQSGGVDIPNKITS